jgi:hypothetical protein
MYAALRRSWTEPGEREGEGVADGASLGPSLFKWDERCKLRNKHRFLLFARQTVDKVQRTWSSATTRPVSGVGGDISKTFPPVCRTFLPQRLLQDIRLMAESALNRDKISDRRTPLGFKVGRF